MELSRLITLCNRKDVDKLDKIQDLTSLSIFRRDAKSDIEAFVYEPAICLILQGKKETSIGNQLIELRPGDALWISHDLPVTSRITDASVQKPYLALILSLDLGLIRSLYDQFSDTLELGTQVRSLSAGPADPA